MKSINNNDIVLINKYLHGEGEELLSLVSEYINSVIGIYTKNAEDMGFVFDRNDLRQAGYKYLDFAINKTLARLSEHEKGINVDVPDFLTYYKWFARQGMLEYLKGLEEQNE